MSISADELKLQLEAAKGELEAAKAHVYRCDGAIQTLLHLIEVASGEKEVNGNLDS